jgi:sterol 24-C-methyltransferase
MFSNHFIFLVYQVELVKGDFMNITLPKESYDAAYAIEATCHAPNRTKCFTEIYNVLKPGGVFAGYEWVTTKKFNKKDPEHLQIKHEIEIGDGLPDITDGDDVIAALENSGFEVELIRDFADPEEERGTIPWYDPFLPNYSSLKNFQASPIGIGLTNFWLRLAEPIGLVPKGTTTIHGHLIAGARGLRKGGETGTFTPMFFFKARKPVKATTSNASSTASAASERGRTPDSAPPSAKKASPSSKQRKSTSRK